MKNFIQTIALATVLGLSSAPLALAQRHGGANGGRSERRETSTSGRTTHSRVDHSSSSTGNRPGLSGGNSGNNNHQRPNVSGNSGNNNHQRPNVSGNSGNNNHQRPNVSGNSGNNNHQRPNVSGNSGNNNHQRPTISGSHNNTNRPPSSNINHGSVNRPATGNRPGVSSGGNRPGVSTGGHRPIYGTPGYNHGRPVGGNHYTPAAPHKRPVILQPPHRPFRPAMARPIYRPTPPPSWRPIHGAPVIRGVLGLTFGITIGSSLDYLYNTGYSVDGYGNDIVYLRNVPMMNYIWTDGALYYGTSGLDASSFYYSTPAYDMSRYNNVYRGLVTSYGVPVSTTNQGGLITSTWFAGNNGYISLSFGNSGGRYLTTLSMGL
ncbi:MAG: hypothetical protein HDR97_07055 [Bacteroides sp.]|nr:hypothetical protein [Bacteroides sp.]